jgi:hypothetical protein
VNYVVTDVASAMAALPGARQYDLRAEHAALRIELASHVLRRQQGE